MTSALLERDESGGVSGTDTGATVLHGLVSDGEFTEVVANHLGLDFNLGDEKCNGDDNDIRGPREKTMRYEISSKSAPDHRVIEKSICQ